MILPGTRLIGSVVRLEPLHMQHVSGLVIASEGGADLYQMTRVPSYEEEARAYVQAALAAGDAGTALPFAVVRPADGAVIGSTRFWDLQRWAWPAGHVRHGRAEPDTCEIGHTWLAPSAIRTGANTEMKRLMLTFAFETWGVQSVCFHTDARNERSRQALSRIGARYEGILRSHRLATDGRARNSARFSVTAEDWPAVKAHLAELSRERIVAS